MSRVLHAFLARIVRRGNLTVETANGKSFHVGDGTGEPLTMRFADRAAQTRLLLNPELALGELFMEGRLVVTGGTIYDLIVLFMSNMSGRTPRGVIKARRLLRHVLRPLTQWNTARRAKRNVAHHYDLDSRLYDLFLDPDKQYSCAYFEHPDQTLAEAQLAKKRHLAAKLLVNADHHVLDIGCGWGGLALYLAKQSGARVTGITLSEEQLPIARARASEQGLSERAQFQLQDYRAIAEQFDRIVSVGMFEHVGVVHYDAFFEKAAQLLTDDGVMLLHAIGRVDEPGSTSEWITKYIFPGGYCPALSEVLAPIERSGLVVTDIEIWRLHYAQTLRAWRERFLARRAEARALYDERFCLMWEFYLAGTEASFRHDGLMVFQIQLAKRQDAVPLTRDYIDAEKRKLGEVPALALAEEAPADVLRMRPAQRRG